MFAGALAGVAAAAAAATAAGRVCASAQTRFPLPEGQQALVRPRLALCFLLVSL